MAVAVHLKRPPHSAHLHAWGRAETGWWGCITWQQRVRTRAGDTEIGFAAWVPAATLTRPGWSPNEDLPRIQLAADSKSWPAPRGWPAWYAGVWLDGPVTPPPGVQLVTGAAWRNHSKLGLSPER